MLAKLRSLFKKPEIFTTPPPAPRGGVVRTKTPEYSPIVRPGGRVIKAMPKSLRKIKEAQERVQ